MFKIFSLIIVILLIPLPQARAENFNVDGEMASEIRYELRQQILTVEGVQQVTLSFVVPQEFSSPTYRQSINEFKLNFTPNPQERKTTSDQRGNQIVTAIWTKIPPAIDVNLAFQSANRTGLSPIETSSPFPPVVLDEKIKEYLAATPQVQSDHPRIGELAQRLTKDVKTQFDAVQRIISFVVDHLQYVSPPVKYDALYSLESGKGNCQNFSHLSAALLRNLRIPTRIVNGITLNQPFDVIWKGGTLTFKMGQGRHSWVEVWFSDLGWVPFDPQNTQLFVSNRFIRVEVGMDNNETKNDGLMRWSQKAETKDRPSLRETINADFSRDKVNLKGVRQAYGPKNLLLTPEVRAQFLEVASIPPPPPPAITIDQDKLIF
ncbi:MAG: transglutaminase domain-containing protein, partial [Smithellaceae bacterium]|nr:transglutaminase domain-containing protein [Smithellaceae bacterium]